MTDHVDWEPIDTYFEKYPKGSVDVILAFPGGQVTHGSYETFHSQEFACLKGWRTGCEGFRSSAEPWKWMPWPISPEE